jgi:hypothetical protein
MDFAVSILWTDQGGRIYDLDMAASALMVQFLAWVADRPRTRADVMEAWRTCPRLSLWEDAMIDGLVRLENRQVTLTARGRAVLDMASRVPGELSDAAASGVALGARGRPE